MSFKQKFPRTAGDQFSSKITPPQGFRFGFGSFATSFGFGFATATLLFGFWTWFSTADSTTEFETTSWIEADASTETTAEYIVWSTTAPTTAMSWMLTTQSMWLPLEDTAWLETEPTWMWIVTTPVRWNTQGPQASIA